MSSVQFVNNLVRCLFAWPQLAIRSQSELISEAPLLRCINQAKAARRYRTFISLRFVVTLLDKSVPLS